MPSRKLTNRCSRCGNKNAMRSNYCNNCGVRLRDSREARDDDSPNKLYADVAHPINQACRDMIQQHVVAEYMLELDRAKLPGYISRYDEAYDAGEISGDYQDPRFVREEETQIKGPHFPTGEQRVARRESIQPGNDSSAMDQPGAE